MNDHCIIFFVFVMFGSSVGVSFLQLYLPALSDYSDVLFSVTLPREI